MKIRTATAEDAETLFEIEKICFTDPWSLASIKGSMESNVFLMAEEEGECVGFVGFSYIYELAQILNIAVAPEHRRQGVAQLLLEEAHAQIFALSVSEIQLEVRVSNMGARHLYEKFGYEGLYERRGYYADNGENAVVYRYKPL